MVRKGDLRKKPSAYALNCKPDDLSSTSHDWEENDKKSNNPSTLSSENLDSTNGNEKRGNDGAKKETCNPNDSVEKGSTVSLDYRLLPKAFFNNENIPPPLVLKSWFKPFAKELRKKKSKDKSVLKTGSVVKENGESHQCNKNDTQNSDSNDQEINLTGEKKSKESETDETQNFDDFLIKRKRGRPRKPVQEKPPPNDESFNDWNLEDNDSFWDSSSDESEFILAPYEALDTILFTIAPNKETVLLDRTIKRVKKSDKKKTETINNVINESVDDSKCKENNCFPVNLVRSSNQDNSERPEIDVGLVINENKCEAKVAAEIQSKENSLIDSTVTDVNKIVNKSETNFKRNEPQIGDNCIIDKDDKLKQLIDTSNLISAEGEQVVVEEHDSEGCLTGTETWLKKSQKNEISDKNSSKISKSVFVKDDVAERGINVDELKTTSESKQLIDPAQSIKIGTERCDLNPKKKNSRERTVSKSKRLKTDEKRSPKNSLIKRKREEPRKFKFEMKTKSGKYDASGKHSSFYSIIADGEKIEAKVPNYKNDKLVVVERDHDYLVGGEQNKLKQPVEKVVDGSEQIISRRKQDTENVAKLEREKDSQKKLEKDGDCQKKSEKEREKHKSERKKEREKKPERAKDRQKKSENEKEGYGKLEKEKETHKKLGEKKDEQKRSKKEREGHEKLEEDKERRKEFERKEDEEKNLEKEKEKDKLEKVEKEKDSQNKLNKDKDLHKKLEKERKEHEKSDKDKKTERELEKEKHRQKKLEKGKDRHKKSYKEKDEQKRLEKKRERLEKSKKEKLKTVKEKKFEIEKKLERTKESHRNSEREKSLRIEKEEVKVKVETNNVRDKEQEKENKNEMKVEEKEMQIITENGVEVEREKVKEKEIEGLEREGKREGEMERKKEVEKSEKELEDKTLEKEKESEVLEKEKEQKEEPIKEVDKKQKKKVVKETVEELHKRQREEREQRWEKRQRREKKEIEEIHSLKKKFICLECGRIFRIIESLRNHQRIHNGEFFTCAHCDRNFISKYALKCHIRIHTNELLTCNNCGKGFTTPELLKVHSRKHTGDRPYFCEICGKGFQSASNLGQHRKIHTEEKKFLCALCGKAFNQKRCLDCHMLKHQEKTHRCHVCGKLWSRKIDLDEHIRVHTGVKPFSCSKCNQQFSQASSLKRHQMVHSNEMPIQCSTCGRKFKCQAYYKRHTKLHKKTTVNELVEIVICG